MVTKQTVIAFTLLILQINDCISFTHTSDKLNAFKIQRSTALNFNIPTFGANENKDDSSDETPEEEKKIGISGLIQLITAGMGSPFLGDFEGVDEETGNFMFSLEANNLVDEVCGIII